jgi:hypothetical protein
MNRNRTLIEAALLRVPRASGDEPDERRVIRSEERDGFNGWEIRSPYPAEWPLRAKLVHSMQFVS